MGATEGLPLHHYYSQPLKVAVFFCVLPLATREQIRVLLERDLITGQIFRQPVLGMLLNHLRILAYRIHKIPQTPEIPTSILVFQVCGSVEDHQCAFTLERPYVLCYTHIMAEYLLENKCDPGTPLPR